MAVSQEVKRVLQRGKMTVLASTRSVGRGIAGVVSYLKIEGRQLIELRDPKGKSLGDVEYRIHGLSFERLAHARSFRKLLKLSAGGGVESDIIRVDTTDGYETERKIK